VGQRQVLTCAHVVAQALGVPEGTVETPQGEVLLDIPLVAPEQRLSARVVCWQPAKSDGSGDVAGLELLDGAPAGANSVRLVQADEPWGHTFRAFGFPKGYENGVWASGRILGREATGWLQIEDLRQTGYFVAPGFSGGPVWDEALDGVVGVIVAADTGEGVRAAFIIPAERLMAAWLQLATWTIPPCPYRGLLAFREQDAPFFFGRGTFAERLFDAVQRHTLVVAVVGPSGSGKSSVVSAGLLPRLRQAAAGHPAGEGWAIAQFRPGSNPFDELADALLPLLEPGMTKTDRLVEVSKLAKALQQGDVALSRVATQIPEENPEAGHLLLVIDQFEELYTLCPDPATRQAFLDLLLQAVSPAPAPPHPSASLHLVLTLRADFFGQALAYRPFADALDAAQKLMLGPMTRQELEAAIVQPARRQGVAFEDGLVARILDEVGEEPGNLPLLEFALTQLWERQEAGRLTHAAYEAISKVEGALMHYADQIYARLDEAEQEQAQRIFVQLVRPGERTEDIRRLATRVELGESNWELVRKLADARLVVTDQDPVGQEVVEIAHEALIRGWGRLRTWMDEDRTFRIWQEMLRAALRQWEASGRDTGALLRGVPLAEAKRWLAERGDDLSQDEQVYVRESVAQALAEYTRLQAILDSSSDGIIVTNVQGNIVQANPVAYTWLTRTLSPKESAQLQETVQDLAQRATERPEAVLELTGLDLHLGAAPVTESGGVDAAVVVAVHDVSHLKALDRMKSRFVTNVSRELRTPITTIKLYAELLRRASPEKSQEYLSALAQEADRQARLVEDILQISRIDSGRLEMRIRPVPLNELTEAAVQGFWTLAKERQITLEHHLAESGPVALVDPDRVIQVLNNLVVNAIQYTPGGGKVVVSTGKGESEGRIWATAAVADTGMGIPEEELPHIFERFFRGERSRQMEIAGTGLGLAIVKEIVELHGGLVTVKSEVNIGSTFAIWLPLAD
jgi:signal transduction histidine kinase